MQTVMMVGVPPELVDPDVAMEIVGGEKIFNCMVKGGWIRPRVQGNRLTRYLVIELQQACRRLALDEALPGLEHQK
ncbi:MAG: hypothetical protein LBK76_09940 [Verrucomicrobiales bacterium]|jgi:hypothetical protein|nr:hypothetical protein [Verrucomicrobiales bacterium]